MPKRKPHVNVYFVPDADGEERVFVIKDRDDDTIAMVEHIHDTQSRKQARGRERKQNPQTERLFELYKLQRPRHEFKKDALKSAILEGIKDGVFSRDKEDEYYIDDKLPLTHKSLHNRFKDLYGKDYDK